MSVTPRRPLAVQPHPYIGDVVGRPLDRGMIYFGEPDKDPQDYPITVYLDPEQTKPAHQPIRTKGGFINVFGDITEIFADEILYSLKVLDCYGRLVFYKKRMHRDNITEELGGEIVRAQKAESALQSSISDETTRAKAAESDLNTGLAKEVSNRKLEVTRLDEADAVLQAQINSVGGGKLAYKTYAEMIADKSNIAAKSSIDIIADTDDKNGTYLYDGTNFVKSKYDLEKLIRAKVQNTFGTYTQMVTSDLSNGAYALVADDTDDKNGIYIKEAGSWVKSKYDPQKTITEIVSNKFTLLNGKVGEIGKEILQGYAVTPTSNIQSAVVYNPNYIGGRHIIRFDVSGLDKVSITNSYPVDNPANNWAWTFTDSSMKSRLYTANFSGNGDMDVPNGAKYLVRGALISGVSNYDATVTGFKSEGINLTKQVVTGAAVTPKGTSPTVSGGNLEGREYVKFDISGHKRVSISNANTVETSSNWDWVFTGSDINTRILDTGLNGSGQLTVPEKAKYLIRTSEIDGQADKYPIVKGLYLGSYDLLSVNNIKADIVKEIGYESVSTTLVIGRVINTENQLSNFAADRAYNLLDVSKYRKVKIIGAKEITNKGPNGDDNWRWVVLASDKNTVLYVSDFLGNGEIVLPEGAAYLVRTAKLHGSEDFDIKVVGYFKGTSSQAEIGDVENLKIKQVEQSAQLADHENRIESISSELNKNNVYITVNSDGTKSLSSERKLKYIVMLGSSVNTNTSDSKLLASGSYRSYIVVDVEGVDKLKQVNGTGRDSSLNWAFTSNMRDRMELSNNATGTGEVLVPAGAKYAVRTFELPSEYNFKESADFEVWAVKNHQTKAEYEDYLKSFKKKAQQLIKESGLPVYKISDFSGSTSHEKINNILKLIKTTNNGGILDLEYGTHLVNSAVVLPSNTWLYLNDAKLKLADGVFDNIIRNEGIVPSDDPFAVATELNQNENIRVFGNNPFDSSVEGPNKPYRAPAPVNPNGDVTWVGDPFGWRTIGILFANVKGYDIHDFNMKKTTAWAMSNEHGCEDMRIHDIWFDTRVANGDGVHFVIGCKKGHVYNINGFTGDDIVAITATQNFLTKHPIYERKQYYYPMAVGGWGDRGHGVDVTDMLFENIAGSGLHQGVRLLCSGGSKLHNITINNIFETAPYGWQSSSIILGTGYGTNAEWGDIKNISINNVDALASGNAIRLNAKISDSVINKVRHLDSSKTLVRQDEAELRDVTITNTMFA